MLKCIYRNAQYLKIAIAESGTQFCAVILDTECHNSKRDINTEETYYAKCYTLNKIYST